MLVEELNHSDFLFFYDSQFVNGNLDTIFGDFQIDYHNDYHLYGVILIEHLYFAKLKCRILHIYILSFQHKLIYLIA